jgi:hypothetical protein
LLAEQILVERRKMLVFPFEIGDLEFFELNKGSSRRIIKQLAIFDKSPFLVKCVSRSNNFQKISTLDADLKRTFISNGYPEIKPVFDCENNIDFDIAIKMKDDNVIFELEKANKEKILYDILKAHIYKRNGFDKIIIMSPKNWVHGNGIIDLFSIAKERLLLCQRYKFGHPDALKDILLVGYTQFFDGKEYSLELLNKINKKCDQKFPKNSRTQ